MPKLLCARPAVDAEEERKIRKLAASRHAPGDWIRRARMVARSWDSLRTGAIAAELGGHPQTVRERLARFNAAGLGGLGDRPGAGRKRRLTETERGRILALARTTPPGRLMPQREGLPRAEDEARDAHWTLDALVAAAAARGVTVGRSQVRRIFRAEGKRWRRTRSWDALVTQRCAAAAVPALSPHDSRRTTGGDIRDAGHDLATAQQLGGHDRRGARAGARGTGDRGFPVPAPDDTAGA